MSDIPHDMNERASVPARESAPPPGWIKPKHGKGMLKPWAPGNKLGGKRPGQYKETQQLARAHSEDAMRALIERLRDPDGRIAVVAANSILERAWGKVREQKPEEHKQAQIDLSSLSSAELALLMRLVDSGRLRETTQDEALPAIVDGNVVETAPPESSGDN